MSGIDGIGARGDFELVGPDAGVDGYAAGNQVGVIGARGVESVAFNEDGAGLHAVAVEGATVDDRGAGGCLLYTSRCV